MNTKIVFLGIALSIFTGLNVYAESFQYTCNPASDNSLQDKVTVVTQGSEALINGKRFTLDANYRPQAANTGYARYIGDTSDFGDDGYFVEVLLKKDLFKGAQTSSIKIRARGEGFFNNYYSCFHQ